MSTGESVRSQFGLVETRNLIVKAVGNGDHARAVFHQVFFPKEYEHIQTEFATPAFWSSLSEITPKRRNDGYINFLQGISDYNGVDMAGVAVRSKREGRRAQKAMQETLGNFFSSENVEILGDGSGTAERLTDLSGERAVGMLSSEPANIALYALLKASRKRVVKEGNPYPIVIAGLARNKSTDPIEDFLTKAPHLIDSHLRGGSYVNYSQSELPIGTSQTDARVASAARSGTSDIPFNIQVVELPEYSEQAGAALADYLSKIAFQHYEAPENQIIRHVG